MICISEALIMPVIEIQKVLGTPDPFLHGLRAMYNEGPLEHSAPRPVAHHHNARALMAGHDIGRLKTPLAKPPRSDHYASTR